MSTTEQIGEVRRPLRILCLYSDWRWTGPAEPVMQMCRGLQDEGNEVVFACRAMPPDIRAGEENTVDKARDYGLDVSTDFALDRYMGAKNTLHDLVHLPRTLKRRDFDVLHLNLSHDQTFGVLCAKFCGRQRPLTVKTMHRRDVPRATRGYRLAMSGFLATDGFLVFTPSFRQRYIERFHLSPDRIALQPMSIDLKRFTPDRCYRDMRAEFGIPAEAQVIGIVTRFQKYRRMDTFVEAAAEVIARRPNTFFLLLGWSGQMEQTVLTPIREHGVEKNVLVAGYRIDDYVDTLACMDAFTLIMPGYDGTARAVREAMAMGKACVVSDIGMLPEIVDHEKTGLVTPLHAAGLRDAWLRLIDHPEERRALGEAALAHARKHFPFTRVGKEVDAFYRRLLAARSGNREGGSR